MRITQRQYCLVSSKRNIDTVIMAIRIHTLLCFYTDQLDSGNPATVIENFKGDDVEMRQFAIEAKTPVTVFIEPSSSTSIFRFFSAAGEMSLCIHGTLAASHVLMQRNNTKHVDATTKNNTSLQISKTIDDTLYVSLPFGHILSTTPILSEISDMLRTPTTEINEHLPCCVATIGSPKLLIPILNPEYLTALQPDFELIQKWSIQNKINGIYAYTKVGLNRFIARGFNPTSGNNEDAATGVAAGALYTALNIHSKIQILQGEAIKMPSRLFVYQENNRIFIGGQVRFV